jgi:hypothetical protein
VPQWVTEGLKSARVGLDPALDVVPGRAPGRPAVVQCGTVDLVAGACRRTIFFPWSPLPVGRDNRGDLVVDDGVQHRRVSYVHRQSLCRSLRSGDQVQRFRQGRTVDIASGRKLNGTDILRCRLKAVVANRASLRQQHCSRWTRTFSVG